MAISDRIRRLVRNRADQRCEYCHASEQFQFVRFTMDHVVPQSAGGGDEPDNLALVCRNCNERRGNRTQARDPTTQEDVPLFDPRQHAWADHFIWDSDRVHILGRTPTGRATAAVLDFNDDRHDGIILRVRSRDLRDGFHPPPKDPVREQ